MATIIAKLNANYTADGVAVAEDGGNVIVFHGADGKVWFQNPDGTAVDTNGNPVPHLGLILAPSYLLRHLSNEGKVVVEQLGAPDGSMTVRNFNTSHGARLAHDNDPFAPITDYSENVNNVTLRWSSNDWHPELSKQVQASFAGVPTHLVFDHRLGNGQTQTEVTNWEVSSSNDGTNGLLEHFHHTQTMNLDGRTSTYDFLVPKVAILNQYTTYVGRLIEDHLQQYSDPFEYINYYYPDGRVQLREKLEHHNDGTVTLVEWYSITQSGGFAQRGCGHDRWNPRRDISRSFDRRPQVSDGPSRIRGHRQIGTRLSAALLRRR